MWLSLLAIIFMSSCLAARSEEDQSKRRQLVEIEIERLHSFVQRGFRLRRGEGLSAFLAYEHVPGSTVSRLRLRDRWFKNDSNPQWPPAEKLYENSSLSAYALFACKGKDSLEVNFRADVTWH